VRPAGIEAPALTVQGLTGAICIIYGTDEAASGRVLDWVRAYRAANPEHFMHAPPMTHQVLEGVSVGMEPTVAGPASASSGRT
jgi:hypothetical protein